MMETIKSYFLSKPGTYDDFEHHTLILNLASQNVCRIYEDHIDLKLIENQHESWHTVMLNEIGENELFEMIDESYEIIMDLLSEEEKKQVFDLEW